MSGVGDKAMHDINSKQDSIAAPEQQEQDEKEQSCLMTNDLLRHYRMP